MAIDNIRKERLKKIYNQISGLLKEDDEALPEYAIKGSGYAWFYDPTQRIVVRVALGIKCYILDEEKDDMGRILVYTVGNDVILIEEDELIYTGFD
jgi:hypothetical protein